MNNNGKQLPEQEYLALEVIYNATTGNEWLWTTPYNFLNGFPWNFSHYENPCNASYRWQGVLCISDSSYWHISELNLPQRNLQGTIPANISNLVALTRLDLSINKLTGTIPKSIVNLKKLRYLYLSANRLQGPIPEGIGSLMDLYYINLRDNKLKGTIPESIVKLKKLRYLYLYSNHLQGSIPKGIGELTEVQLIALYGNQLTGIIPESITALNKLQYLLLYSNRLQGSIPEGIGNLTALSVANFHENQLTGTIPESITNLTNLQYLYLSSNLLRGSIPEGIGNQTELLGLDLGSNMLTGIIPANLMNLWKLRLFYLYSNYLQGSIPKRIGNLTDLYFVELSHNHLTGTIPASIVNLTKLQLLYLNANDLKGSIPEGIGNLTEVYYFDLSDNQLTGTIPESITNLNKLQYLYLRSNLLQRSIPKGIGNLTALTIANFHENQLTGTIPESITNLKQLQSLYLSSNYLRGSIPEGIRNIVNLVQLEIQENLLSGVLPVFDGKLISLDASDNFLSGTISTYLFGPNLTYLNIEGNKMYGTIPISICKAISLQQLDLANNLFSGKFPSHCSVLANNNHHVLLPKLQVVQLWSNYFTGNVPLGLLQENVQIVYLDHNQFSGSIPEQWFDNAKNLTSLVMAVNCLTGTIPVGICNSHQLEELSLDGLHASSECTRKIFSFSSAYYVTTNQVEGTIPDCVFALPQLQQLQLSGNGFEGRIPSILSSSITTLVLASNQFTGTIPMSVWNAKNLSYLDVSFNKLRDILPTNQMVNLLSDSSSNNNNNNISYSMQVNRLSGNIPSYFISLQQIDMLEGNHFTCQINRKNLPSNDPSTLHYLCGSDATNNSLYVWMSVIVMIIGLGLIVWRCFVPMLLHEYHHSQLLSFLSTISIWWKHSYDKTSSWKQPQSIIKQGDNGDIVVKECEDDIERNSKSLDLQYLSSSVCILTSIVKLCICYVIAILFIVIILIVLHNEYSMYIDSYIWMISAAFLTGTIPAYVLLSLFCLLLILFGLLSYEIIQSSLQLFLVSLGHLISNINTTINITNSPKITSSDNTWQDKAFHAIMLLINLLVILTINFLYVYVAANGIVNVNILVILSILFSIFKCFWNSLLRTGSFLHSQLFFHLSIQFDSITLLFISLFNNILVPYIADIFVSPNCFLYAIKNPPSISVTLKEYIGKVTGNLMVNIISYNSTTTVTTSSVVLSSTILSNGDFTLHYYPSFQYSYQCSSLLLSIFASVFIYRFLISGILQPLYLALIIMTRQYWTQWEYEDWRLNAIPSIWRWLLICSVKYDVKHSKDTHNAVVVDVDSKSSEIILQALAREVKNLNLSIRESVEVMTSLAMMFTFGVLFPPLLIVIVVSICMRVIMFRLLIGLWLWLIQETVVSQPILSQQLLVTLQSFDRQWHSFAKTCEIGLVIVFFLSSLVWSFSLFDMLGDEVGANQAYWIVLVMNLFPFIVLLFLLLATVRRMMIYHHNSNTNPVTMKSNSAMADDHHYCDTEMTLTTSRITEIKKKEEEGKEEEEEKKEESETNNESVLITTDNPLLSLKSSNNK